MAYYTETSLETAACLWEAVLFLCDHPVTDPDRLALSLDIGKAFDTLGTAALRMTVVGWAEAVETAWRAVEDDYPLRFDWDFVPAWIIDTIDWSDPHHPAATSRPKLFADNGEAR